MDKPPASEEEFDVYSFNSFSDELEEDDEKRPNEDNKPAAEKGGLLDEEEERDWQQEYFYLKAKIRKLKCQLEKMTCTCIQTKWLNVPVKNTGIIAKQKLVDEEERDWQEGCFQLKAEAQKLRYQLEKVAFDEPWLDLPVKITEIAKKELLHEEERDWQEEYFQLKAEVRKLNYQLKKVDWELGTWLNLPIKVKDTETAKQVLVDEEERDWLEGCIQLKAEHRKVNQKLKNLAYARGQPWLDEPIEDTKKEKNVRLRKEPFLLSADTLPTESPYYRIHYFEVHIKKLNQLERNELASGSYLAIGLTGPTDVRNNVFDQPNSYCVTTWGRYFGPGTDDSLCIAFNLREHDVVGCGLVQWASGRRQLFFTRNGGYYKYFGIYRGKIRPPLLEEQTVFYPTASMASKYTIVEANFGTDPAKPFVYDIANHVANDPLDWLGNVALVKAQRVFPSTTTISTTKLLCFLALFCLTILSGVGGFIWILMI